VSEVLAHRGRALTPEETEELLRDRLGDHVQRAVVEYGVFTLWIAPDGWLEAARHCRDERLLAYDLFDSLFGIDAREDGFDVVAVLYSTSTGNRIALRARCAGGREAPSLPSITEVYRGADWMERETYDMFGIDFPGHPGLEPRILTVENFEGWPLRKDFHLASRVAKPWPGVAEPVELDEDGNKIERERSIGDAPVPTSSTRPWRSRPRSSTRRPCPAVEAEARRPRRPPPRRPRRTTATAGEARRGHRHRRGPPVRAGAGPGGARQGQGGGATQAPGRSPGRQGPRPRREGAAGPRLSRRPRWFPTRDVPLQRPTADEPGPPMSHVPGSDCRR
jgi:NADH:ubiquinone oxidoreductase subunit C